MVARLSDDEYKRFAALPKHQILDTAPEQEYDDLVRLAAHVCGVPIAAISLVDEHRQWFKAIIGLPVTETLRDTSFCAHTILHSEPLVIQDVQGDPRFADNVLVTEDAHIRFYAGVPLVAEDGHILGSLCVIDRAPKILTSDQIETLRLLAHQVTSHLKAARRMAERERLAAEKERLAAEREYSEMERLRLAAIVESSEDAILSATLDGTVVSWNSGAERLYGYAAAEMLGRSAFALAGPDQESPVPSVIKRLLNSESVETMEVTRRHRNGSQFQATLSFSPIRNAAGEMVGLACIARDITARKKTEAALAESEARLRLLTDAAFEGVAVSQAGVLVEVSPAFATMFAYASPLEMIGMVGIELVAPESRALAAHKLATSDEHSYEATLLRCDGTTFQAELRGRQIYFGGNPARVTAVRDISDRKAMEAEKRASHHALRENEARLAEAQRVAQIGNWEYDLATGRLSWSDELFRLLELDPALGPPSIDALMTRYHPDDVAMHREFNAKALQDGLPYEFDIRILRRDGSIRWAHAVGQGELARDGGVVRLFGTLMDIHERKLAEERFRILFEQSSNAHLLCVGSKVVDCNDATLSLLRCRDKEQMLSLHPAFLSPEFQPDGKRSDEKGLEMEALARERGSHRFEWIHRKMDGEDFPVEVTLTPVTLADDTALLAVLHDLTERKQAEQQILDHTVVIEFQKSELERANAELERLATMDSLTELKNRRAFQERLSEEVNRSGRYGPPLSLILLDVDHFKGYNDTFGHPQGDDVLRHVASLLREIARESDLAARYGGEEFALILPQTDLEGAAAFAERLRASVECHPWPLRAVTASLGVACLRCEEGETEIIARADAAMYQSKTAGRNRVTCASGPAVPPVV